MASRSSLLGKIRGIPMENRMGICCHVDKSEKQPSVNTGCENGEQRLKI